MALDYIVNVGFKVDSSSLKTAQAQFQATTTATNTQTTALGNMAAATKTSTAALKEGEAAQKSWMTNSRTMYSLSALIEDAATGQFSRSKREVGALASETGALQRVIAGVASPIGAAFAIITAAVVTLAIAYKQANAEGEEFSKALKASGDASGLTVSDLKELSEQITITSKSLTDKLAGEALAAVVKSGVIASDSIEKVSKATAQWSQLTGEKVGDIVKTFAALGDQPVTQSAKLNASMHYLTASTIENIKSLEDQGHTMRAGVVAMDALADEIDKRSQESAKNIGLLSSAWMNLKHLLADNSPVEQLDALAHATDVAKANLQTALSQVGDGKFHILAITPEYIANMERMVKEAQAAEDAQYKLVSATDAASTASKNNATVVDYLANENKKYTDATLTQAQKRERATNDEIDRAEAAVKAAGNDSAKIIAIKKQEVATLLGINATYKDPKVAAVPKGAADPAIAALKSFEDQANLLTAKVTSDTGPLGIYMAALQKAGVELNKVLLVTHTSAQDNAAATIFLKEQTAATNEYNKALDKQNLEVALYKENLAVKHNIFQQSLDDQVKAIGQSETEIKQSGQINNLLKEQADAQEKLNKQLTAGSLTTDAYTQSSMALFSNNAADMKSLIDSFAQLTTAQSHWENGAKAAWKNYQDQAANVAEQTKVVFDDTFNGLTDAFATFITTGKLSFSDLAKSIIADLAKILAKMALVAAIKTATDLYGFSYVGAANGAVYDQGKKMFANGAVVNTSTNIGMVGNSMGIAGEAGPEAIIPLTRKNGKLGIDGSSMNTGLNQVNTYAPTINITTSGGSNEDSAKTAKLVDAVMKVQFAKWLQDSMRSGNALNPGFRNRQY